MKFKMLTLAAMLAVSTMAPSAWADMITLNPSATNGGAGTLDAGTSAFNTDNSQIAFASLLNFGGGQGVNLGFGVGVSTFTESGNFQILNFNPAPTSTTNVTDTYNIYGTFSISGLGLWVSPTNFVSLAINTFDSGIYGSPGCTTSGSHPSNACAVTSGLTFGSPTTSTPVNLAGYGITQGANDFLLGNASIQNTLTNFAQVSLSSTGSSGSATQSILALLDFVPAANTTGIGGFWEAPVPFNIDIGSQAGGNDINTAFTKTAGVYSVRVSNVAGVNQGGGSLNYRHNAIPEPTTLALLGLGLLGLAFSTRSKKA